METISLNKEVEILANYLVGSSPITSDYQLFSIAVTKYDLNVLHSKEARLWVLCLENPWLFPFIDGGLSILDRNCIFRKRLYFLLNILEASPYNYDKFIFTRKNKFIVLLNILFLCLMGLLHSVAGVVLVKMFR
jgi:hypothetical protein